VALTIDNSSGLLNIGFSEVTITRTLFRSSGESEYAINGVPCRLLDVQELLSDSGVGRQQHLIVSQGNLDQVLDVRPEDRRLVIEEAAGILKFRRRKEKAERRLEATEAHLVRLGDLLKELKRQMRPLERQAEAARRQGELAAELRALRLHLSGRSIASLQARADASGRDRARLATEEAAVHAEARRLDQEVAVLEARLTAVDLGGLEAVAGRLAALRERARGLAALAAERARALAADVEAAAAGDDPLAALEADLATLGADIVGADAEAAELAAALEALAEAEGELARRRHALARRELAEQAVRKAAETRGELAALQAATRRSRAEVAELERTAAGLDAVAGERAAAVEAGQGAVADAVREQEAAAAALAAADEARAAAASALAAASTTRQTAERARDAAAARVEALTLALGSGGPVEADAEGFALLGPLLELVEIDAGWEPAVEAALGDALTALVVADVEAARQALRRGTGGSVLVGGALGTPSPAHAPGVVDLPGQAVRKRVRAGSPHLNALLDRLLAGAVIADGGWEDALDLAWRRPDLVVVTWDGDRFGPSGWRTAASGPSVAAALAEAKRRVDGAVREAEKAAAAEAEAGRAAETFQSAHTEARAAFERARQHAVDQRAALTRLEAEHRQALAAAETARAHVAALAARVVEDERRAAVLDQQLALPLGEAGDDPGTPLDVVDLDAEREEVAWEAQGLAARRAQLVAQSDAVARRRAELGHRLAQGEARLAEARTHRFASEARASRNRVDLAHTVRLGKAVAATLATVDARLADAEQRRERQAVAARALAADLAAARARRADAERRLEETRARGRRAELDEAETRLRLEGAVEALRRELEVEPDVAVSTPCPPLPEASSPASRARELERELRLLGPVNPLAMEELAALEERHSFLAGQLEDVKSTRRELNGVIRSVEAEMTGLLAAAYADVAENFSALFETLFPGGEGRLRLTDPDHILDAGVEIDARPGGKSARKLSLLSGGERSLCAMAFLFAVFRSRPSPFYLLDEVEAALDDVNLHRFLRLLDEFRNEAQLVVVTHQKRTMEAADCLFGVTMQPGGTSRVLSERVAVGRS
jgi:chromosome segregation protein